jgi:hypothetical protein
MLTGWPAALALPEHLDGDRLGRLSRTHSISMLQQGPRSAMSG